MVTKRYQGQWVTSWWQLATQTNRDANRHKKLCDSTSNGTDQYQNGSSNLFTPYREQPRSTRIVVAYPRPAFSATNRTNCAPTSFDRQVQVSQGHTLYKNKEIEIPRSMVVEALGWRSRRASQHLAVQSPVDPWKSPTNLARSPLLVALVGRNKTVSVISVSLRNLPVQACDSRAQGFSPPLARRRSTCPPPSPNLVRTHPIKHYQALRDSAPCLSRAATLPKVTKLELGRGAHLGTPSSTNHTAAMAESRWQPVLRVSPALHLPERPSPTHTPKPGFGGRGYEVYVGPNHWKFSNLGESVYNRRGSKHCLMKTLWKFSNFPISFANVWEKGFSFSTSTMSSCVSASVSGVWV